MRLFSSRAKTKRLAQSHIIRKNLKEQEQSLLNDSLSSVVSRIQPLLSSVPKLDLGRSSSMASLFRIYGSSFPWVPLLYWKFTFSPPTENVYWSSLTHPPISIYPLCSSHLLLPLLIVCGHHRNLETRFPLLIPILLGHPGKSPLP